MKVNVYAVYDEVAKIFRYDFMRVRDGEAIRYFGDSCMQEKTEFFSHPADFSLFRLAVYDNETGRYENLEIPERISRATDFVGATVLQ